MAEGVAEIQLDPQKGSTTPVNSQPAPGTWLGSVVHDPDESFGQEVVVGGLLGGTGHWELDSL